MTDQQVKHVAGMHVRVAIIGAGFAGIGAALQLVERRERSFAVLEQAEQVGGTWRDNVYPGVACDIPSHLYSYSFVPKTDWQHRYAPGAEIHRYLQDCVEQHGLSTHLRLSTALENARWDAATARWELTTNRGRFTASVLVLATGRFSAPHVPTIPGLNTFDGPVCHSARWDSSIRSGMRVAVVGSGASAIQIVPALAAAGSRVVNVQRSAAWIIPKGASSYTSSAQQSFRDDEQARLAYRATIYAEAEAGFAARILGSTAQIELKHRAIEHLRTHIQSQQLVDLLTPDYEMGCKRVLLSDDFYPAIASEQVDLHRGTITRIEKQRITLSDGTTHTVDAIVFATGFEASQPEIATRIFGRNHLRLADHWRDGMVSYASTVVTGFPNLFVLGGPNSALGHNSAIAIMETQIQHLLSAMDYLATGWTSCEVTASAEQNYAAALDERAAKTVWLSNDCASWYRHQRTGRLTLLWPGTAEEYRAQFSHFNPAAFHFEGNGTPPACPRVPQPVQSALC